METPEHDFGNWTFEKYSVSGITHSCRVRLPSGFVAFTSALEPDQEKITRLISTAPRLLTALERALDLLESIAERLLYEEGQPVTFLESREIEDTYSDAICELASFETLIREARGQA
jgi:hypothetical protein